MSSELPDDDDVKRALSSEPPPEETQLSRVEPTVKYRSRPRLSYSDDGGERVVLIERRVLVGSSPRADVVVQHAAVSRVHVELIPREDGLWVRDVGSRNGTFVEGIRVDSALVPPNGRLHLGPAELRVSYDAERQPVELWPSDRYGPLFGGSAVMRELFATVDRVAGLDSPVLIQGETGTGKELVARAIHERSPRKDHPLVVVDCAALPEHLLDAELFGHTKQAFTGATTPRIGAFESAEGGTVFLDEVGDLPLAMQPRLLRVIETRTVRRIGESTYRNVDIRFLAATHRDLSSMVASQAFREDLFFRLSVLPVTVPPLRERRRDIGTLLTHFLADAGAAPPSRELVRQLEGLPWRGNVRELRNFADRARALGQDEALARAAAAGAAASADASPPSQRFTMPVPIPPTLPRSPAPRETEDGGVFLQAYKEFRERWIDLGEREYVSRLLTRHGRNVTAAARDAGLDRTYLYRLIRKHEL